jgi:sulfur-carrier protein
MVQVLLFGRLADVAGWRERLVDPAPGALSALRRQIGAEDPQLAEALAGVGVRAAVDQVLSRGDVSLNGVKEVAFMSPMSGG